MKGRGGISGSLYVVISTLFDVMVLSSYYATILLVFNVKESDWFIFHHDVQIASTFFRNIGNCSESNKVSPTL